MKLFYKGYAISAQLFLRLVYNSRSCSFDMMFIYPETESENSLRRAMRDEQRMRDGLIQSNSALANTANLLAMELSKQVLLLDVCR